MTSTRMLEVVPIATRPDRLLRFRRATVLPGVWVQQYSGVLAGQIDGAKGVRNFISRGFQPTHLIVVEVGAYWDGLDRRLLAEGTKRKVRADQFPDFIEIDAIARQVLIAMTLIGRLAWKVEGSFSFDASQGKPRMTGYSPRPTAEVRELFRYGHIAEWWAPVSPRALRSTCIALDAYYRSGVWWVDRLSIALGYLWSSLTTREAEFAFSGLCMALEAIATSNQNEITHILAERCAVLCRKTLADRRVMYSDIKRLYGLRSKIVHGRSGQMKGPITTESLFISAKRSSVPATELCRLLRITLDVINSVLHSQDLIKIPRIRQSDNEEHKQVEEYFLSQLLR